MAETHKADRDAYSEGYDDKSDTVMTGFNTDDHLDEYDRLLDINELNDDNKSSKSVGKQVKIPFARDVPDLDHELEEIIEISGSDEEAQPDSPEKRMVGELAITPHIRLRANPPSATLGFSGMK